MSHVSKKEYLESCRQRYLSRNRMGRSAMIDEVIDTFGWKRKHAIKALKGKVTRGNNAKKRGSKSTHGEEEKAVIVYLWKHSEQPCGVRLKETLPLWLESYEQSKMERSQSRTCQQPHQEICADPLRFPRV